MKARKRKKRRSSRTNNAPAPAVGAGVETARRAATARRKLAKRALYVGQVLLLLLTADWVLQEPGVEAHRVVAVSAYVLQGAAALLLAFEALPGAVAVFAPANRNALQTALFGCVGACNDVRGSGDDTYCHYADDGPWESGTGMGCHSTSAHGAIDTWDVARITSMYRSG